MKLRNVLVAHCQRAYAALERERTPENERAYLCAERVADADMKRPGGAARVQHGLIAVGRYATREQFERAMILRGAVREARLYRDGECMFSHWFAPGMFELGCWADSLGKFARGVEFEPGQFEPGRAWSAENLEALVWTDARAWHADAWTILARHHGRLVYATMRDLSPGTLRAFWTCRAVLKRYERGAP